MTLQPSNKLDSLGECQGCLSRREGRVYILAVTPIKPVVALILVVIVTIIVIVISSNRSMVTATSITLKLKPATIP